MTFAQDIKDSQKTTIPLVKRDTTFSQKKDSLFSIKKDSILFKNRDTISNDSIKPKESVDDIITHIAKDYTIQNAKDKTVTL